MVALNIALIALTALKRPVHAPNRHAKTRLNRHLVGSTPPTATGALLALNAATGEDTHDIWTG